MTVEELQIIISSKTEGAQAKIKSLKNSIANIQPRKSPDVNVSTAKAQSSLKKLQSELDRTQKKIDKINGKMSGVYASQDAIVSKYMDVPALSGMTQPQTVDTMVGNDPHMQEYNAQIGQLETEMAPLQAHLSEVKSQIANVGAASSAAAEKTEKLGRSMRTADSGIKRAGQSSGYFGRMVKSMIVSMALYSGMSFIFSSLASGIQSMAQGSASANGTISRLATSALYLKNSIASALMPTIQALTPAITTVCNALARAFNEVAMITAALFGNARTVTVANSAGVNYAKTLGTVGKSANKAKGSLASFDQLNVLNKQDSSSAGSANPGAPAPGSVFKQIQIPQSVLNIADIIKAQIAQIMAVIPGALIAIGVILVLTGANIPLGIGMIIAGAAGLAAAVALNWGSMTTQLLSVFTSIMAALGGFLLVLGLILCLSGANIPLGIGLILMGAASLAAAVALNWNSTKTSVVTVLSGIAAAISGVLLGLGLILCLSGANIPLGIGLIAVGAIGLASVVALNWSGVSTQVKNIIVTITAAVGTAFLVLGAILTFSGANIPLGIGLILMGAASLAAAASINWNTVKNTIKRVLADILAVASTAAVAIGILLCLTGAGIPLGIGLILAGIGGIHAAANISDTPIVNRIRGMMNSIIGIVETGVNWCINKLNSLAFTVPNWVPGVGGSRFGFNISTISIPRLATGGVVKGATPIIAGEAGAEAIVPLERNTEWIDNVVAKFKADLSGSSTGNTNATIIVKIGDDTLINKTIKGINRKSRSGQIVLDV